jgi:hypothetical protein
MISILFSYLESLMHMCQLSSQIVIFHLVSCFLHSYLFMCLSELLFHLLHLYIPLRDVGQKTWRRC